MSGTIVYNPFTDNLDYRGASGGGGTGDVTGPASSVDNDIAVFDGVTGKIIKDGGKTIAQIAPLTTKGDLYGFSTDNTRIPVGADGLFLQADSAEPEGIKWAMSSSGTPEAFAAYILNTTSDNLTGTGSFVTVPFDSLFFDTSGGFNVGTGVYTVPSTGIWNFNFNLFPYRLGGANTFCVMNFLVGGTTAYRTYEVNYENISTSGEVVLNGSILLNLTVGETIEVQCAVGGVALNIGFGGTASLCRFSGFKVGT